MWILDLVVWKYHYLLVLYLNIWIEVILNACNNTWVFLTFLCLKQLMPHRHFVYHLQCKDPEPDLFPSTSMAAHVMDEVVDIETDGNPEVAENFSGKVEQGVADVHRFPFQLPPPPPLPRNFHLQVSSNML